MLPWLEPSIIVFPDTQQALNEPNGLLAAGGALTTDWLIAAYRRGIFPWFNEGDPILWWTPSPRMVLQPHQLHISKSLRKTLRHKGYRVSCNRAFNEVIAACAAPRSPLENDSAPTESPTWITPAMREAYVTLHQAGYAQSIEVWQHGKHTTKVWMYTTRNSIGTRTISPRYLSC